VPHGRTVEGASQSVPALIEQEHGGTRRDGGSREPRQPRVCSAPDPQSARTPCLTGASSKARASPFRLASNRKMEVRAATEVRVSLCIVASALPPIRRARRPGASRAHPQRREPVCSGSHQTGRWRYAPQRHRA
jgi:hypothetical protein